MEHLAIIADGNRRWAASHNFSKEAGYWRGLKTIENCCEWCINNSINFLTVFCLSTENWKRKEEEINMLFRMAETYLDERLDWYLEKKIRVRFLGRRDHFKPSFVEKMENLEKTTERDFCLTLTLCIDYGGRDEIARAISAGCKTEKEINEYLNAFIPDPDLILRTGGYKRLSNFLLWQAAYSELFFTDALFPDLTDEFLDSMKQEFNAIQRNFGG